LKETYPHVDKDTLALLQEFLEQVKQKTIGYAPARYIPEALVSLHKFPELPARNCCIKFEADYETYQVVFSDTKIELSCYVHIHSNETFQKYSFRYEADGEQERLGDQDEFRTKLLHHLKKVFVTDITITEVEG